MPHELKVCVLSTVCHLLHLKDVQDELCDQLYMDRLGHGINGVVVARSRSRK